MFHQSDKITYIDTHWKKIYRFERPPNCNYINKKGGLNEDDEDDHLIYKFKLKMANTLSVMTNVLRNVVSKKRIRYKENGFDLDLAYISDNIIAMGYPADNLESIYRNRLEDVYKFLEEHHQDHYRIYNLCLERSYDKNKFHGRVAVYPFEDHNPPTIELIQKFCNDVDTWLRADTKNVAAVHCKAGKGRTGTMICCYLLYSGQHGTPEEALAYYDSKRTKDRKGVTIPSQRRYVQYFSKLLQSQKTYEKCTLQFCEIRFMEAHILHNQGTVYCTISVLQDTCQAVKVETLQNVCMDFRKNLALDLRHADLDVTGDIKIELSSKPARKKIFHFWFNTYFISSAAETEGEGDDERYVYTLNKWEIDDVHKDKEHKCYPENFKVQLVFYKNAGKNRNQQAKNTVSGNRTSSSSNYEFSLMGNVEAVSGRNYMTHNSYPLTTGVAMSTQHNNSGSLLSYNCDQRSSSSSVSVSSLAGGSGSASGSGNDSTKQHKFISENKFKMTTSNGNASGFHEDIGAPPDSSLVQTSLSEYNNFSTEKQRMLRQHYANKQIEQQQQQQQQNQYQPSENNVPVSVTSSKVSGKTVSNNINSINNHSMSNGVLLYANSIVETDRNECNNDRDHEDAIVDDDDNEDDDDADADADEEDWESGESSAISLAHLKKTPLNTDNNTETTTTITATTDSQKTIHSSFCPIVSLSPSIIKTRTTTHLTNRNCTNKMFSNTSNLCELTSEHQCMNLSPPFTNTSPNSSCSLLYSKTEIGGENDSNGYIHNVINETEENENEDENENEEEEDGGDDDNKKIPSNLGPKSNGKAALMNSKENSNTDNPIGVPPTSRNKFFSFASSTKMPSKQPFFRRKSFKSGNSNSAGSGDLAFSSINNINEPSSTSMAAYTGLASTSKQKLKLKLKKNRFKLAQKFQKLQNYLRADPDDFCKSLVQQTIVRRNSNCSLTNRNQNHNSNHHKPTVTKLSTSPENSSTKNCLPSPSSFEQLAILQSSSSFSPSATASNASLGSKSSADCDLSCDCNDYYSSICDNQLSFENSPCKSPRSLADIALMSGNHNHHHRSTNSFNAANSLGSSFQQQKSTMQQNSRLPFLVSKKNFDINPRHLKDQHKLRQEINKDVVVVAAKPAKIHSIGFNVATKETTEPPIDCVDGSIINSVEDAATNIDEKRESSISSAYFTPSISEEETFNTCTKETPFIFPTIIDELSNLEHTTEGTTPSKPLNLLILKNTSSTNNQTSSLESIENIGDSYDASFCNGNNTAETGTTSSSGFSTSECCSSNSNNHTNDVCNCNPLVLDLERYAGETKDMQLNKKIIIEEKIKIEEEPIGGNTIIEHKETAKSIKME